MPIRGYTLMNISESVMEIMIDTRREYNLLSKEELVAMYNEGEQNGFQGTHMKVVNFVALHLALWMLSIQARSRLLKSILDLLAQL